MIYEKVLRPLLFAVDPERSHHLALSGLQTFHSLGGGNLLGPWFNYDHPSLHLRAFNLNFPNPIGLAAGFDKDARYLEALAWLGFGFMEAGTVTFHPQTGNPKPRLMRIPEADALWNHLGFNNDGAQAVLSRLKQVKLKVALGINLGKSKIAPIENAVKDYLLSFRLLNLLGDYIVLNVSSPNTPGLRSLQDKEKLSGLLREIEENNSADKPVFIKVSPDLTPDALKLLLEVAMQYKIRGVIATNTTLSRHGIEKELPSEGGVSGKPLQDRSTQLIRLIYKSAGKELCIIGCGGVFSAEDAYEKIKAGASLVQIYTGLVYRGPGIVKKIKEGLVDLLHRDRFNSIGEAIGVEADERG